MIILRRRMTTGWACSHLAFVLVSLVSLVCLSQSQSPGPVSTVNYGYTATLAAANAIQPSQEAPIATTPLRTCASPAQCRSLCSSTLFADLPAGEDGMASVPQQVSMEVS